mmetsp:Transcript_4069/g.7419  ORF Transcript_4069/g.7419 Transcript_4069/m.7419 type:complete len:81 (-) Transcript_4069:634-876(-)
MRRVEEEAIMDTIQFLDNDCLPTLWKKNRSIAAAIAFYLVAVAKHKLYKQISENSSIPSRSKPLHQRVLGTTRSLFTSLQ